jgi:OOP family OmpA-OmpF porin
MMMFRFITVLLAFGVLSACSSGLTEKAEDMKPGEDKFLSGLHAEYIALAKAEDDEFDFLDADHFASKAIKVGGGTAVGPDGIKSRKLPAGTAAALKAAEKRLNKVLKSGAANYAPQQMAKAQAMYDCWLQEQEEGHQPNDIRACRIAYLDAMDVVDGAKPMPAAAKPKKKKKKKAPVLGPFYIYFPFDVSDPEDPFNDEIFSLVVSAAKKVGDKSIKVTGHTDRAGNSKYNMMLSKKRSISVKAALIKRGVDAKRMNVFYLGEESPATATKDGVRSDNNRRVEIVIR